MNTELYPDPPSIFRKWNSGDEKVTSYSGRVWCVRDLRNAVKDQPVFELPLAFVPVSSHSFDCGDLVEFAQHMLHVQQADLTDPIIMDNRGQIIDGRHRVVKALLEGLKTIPCKRVPDDVLPSHFDK